MTDEEVIGDKNVATVQTVTNIFVTNIDGLEKQFIVTNEMMFNLK